MILDSIRLRNFRIHRDLQIKLKPGVTGIVGENGQGKSSIIEAIQFLLTGSLFEGNKEQAITLGESTGYVSGEFTLNGIKGKIERHLDASKTILTYDGTTYKKATEVKEIWDKLLQINAEIFERVIIARQGQIAALYSGDQSVREKVFQKIFMVPPTEKLRTLIWDKYIKLTPPEIPVEDRDELLRLQEEVQLATVVAIEERDACNVLTDDQLDDIRVNLQHLQKCKIDEAEHKDLRISLGYEQHLLADAITRRDAIKEKLGKVNIEVCNNAKSAMEQQRTLAAQRQELENELAEFTDREEIEAAVSNAETTVRQAETWFQTWEGKFNKLTWELESLDKRLDMLDQLEGETNCPTCGQALHDTFSTMDHIKEEVAKKTQEKDSVAVQVTKSRNELELSRKCLERNKTTLLRYDFLRKQIEQLANVTYNETQYTKICQIIDRYNKLMFELNEQNQYVFDQEHTVSRLEARIANLAKYTGEEPIDDAIRALSVSIHNDRAERQKKQDLEVRVQVLGKQTKDLERRIQICEENTGKNAKRKAYIDKLTAAYELLHVSQFPRKLILSYANLVTDYLDENLSMFHIPYKSRVNENFRIDMLDDECRVMPLISGGQEIVVGLSLHLALHDLFSQSFPMMIIDEGTTHLSTKNQKAYFEVIRTLKEKSKLKQIIIIDHNPQLAGVVDHTIQL